MIGIDFGFCCLICFAIDYHYPLDCENYRFGSIFVVFSVVCDLSLLRCEA